MRLAVTVVAPRKGRAAHILLDADPGMPVADLAARLTRYMLSDAPPRGPGQAGGDAAHAAGRVPPLLDRWTHPPSSAASPFEQVGLPLYIDGQPVPSRVPLASSPVRDGCVISLGGPEGCVPPEAVPDGVALARSADGVGFDFNRPPRLLPPGRTAAFTLPVPPPAPERRPLPVLMVALPLVMGVAMALLLHQVYLLAMAGLSPVMLVGSALSERKQGRKANAARQAGYAEHKARIEHDTADAVAAELTALREQCPDPAEVLSVAAGPRRRLWERRRTDPDYLLLRVGTGDLPSSVRLTDPTADEHRRTVTWPLRDAPVTVPLRERGVIGLAGQEDSARAAGRWLVAQAATLHSPNDLWIYVLTDSAGKARWEWVRWLPHCRPGAGGEATGRDQAGSFARVGNDAESVAGRIAELLAIIAARQQALRDTARGAGDGHARFGSDIIVVLDGSRKLRALPGVIQLLREGPGTGVYAVCLDSDEPLLPAECQAVAALDPGGLRVQQMLTQSVTGARADHVDPDWCTRLARALAPVRDVSASDDDVGLPDSARLLDVLRLEPPAAGLIAAGWRAGGRSTVAVVGESYDGPFGIDIRRDGPHGLIAGTTGSGKSELLQTIIAALAVANRPDELTFVLIDYKGGSAFADCARLPHTAGMVTDLGPHLVQRALASLTAEVTRRERLLAQAGAKDIEDYQRTAADGLARLVIVIDEFASLARDLPDFVTGLVGIAQRGRSLGLHLLLATQRPSGVVSADIRANANLRIALRVTDPGESSDVLDAPDAAYIAKATPGRAYVRLGHGSLVPFQAGRVGGPRPRAAKTPLLAAPPDTEVSHPGQAHGSAPGPVPTGEAGSSPERLWLAPVFWTDLGKPEPAPPPEAGQADGEVTDLKVLVKEIQLAARDLGIRPQPSPWLPPLPGSVQLARVWQAAVAPGRPDERSMIPFGITDLPHIQAQTPAGLDLVTFSHLMAAGAPRSGRSQLLRTIAGALARARDCGDLHLYGLDCGNGALLPLADLPHCGAVVGRAEAERAGRLLRRLGAELTRRQELLAAGGHASVTEQRQAQAGTGAETGRPLPHLFLLLDQWEGFTATLGEADGGALTDVLTRILGEGASAGMHLIMTGDRSLLAGRVSALCEEKLVFRLAEREDYALAGLRPRDLPEDIPSGRAFRAGTGTEVQVALLGPDLTGQGQAAALRAVAGSCAQRDAAVPAADRPFRVDAIPARVSFEQAWALRPAAAPASGNTVPAATGSATTGSGLWALVGAGGDSLAALGPDLGAGVPAFVVAGPGGSGRSTILLAMARSLLAGGTHLVLVTPRLSPLRSLAGRDGVAATFTGTSLGEEELASVLAAVEGPLAVVIDDAELLRDCDASGELSRVIAAASADAGPAFRRALVLAGDPEAGLCAGFGGWQIDAKRARRGALTAPTSVADGELIGVRLTRAQAGQPARPGRCLLNTGDGHLVTVTVPAA
jgi:DNA segregation ATPase FtsK/SpoIIIE, S-DNA-T family